MGTSTSFPMHLALPPPAPRSPGTPSASSVTSSPASGPGRGGVGRGVGRGAGRGADDAMDAVVGWHSARLGSLKDRRSSAGDAAAAAAAAAAAQVAATVSASTASPEAPAGGKGHALSDMTVSSSTSGGNDDSDGSGGEKPARTAGPSEPRLHPLLEPEDAFAVKAVPVMRRARRERRDSSSSSSSSSGLSATSDDDVGCHTCSSNSIRVAMSRLLDDAAGVAPPASPSPPPPPSPSDLPPDLGPASLRRQLSQSFIKEPSSAAALFKHMACLQWKSFVPGIRRHSHDEDEDDEDGLRMRMGMPVRVRAESSYQSPGNRRRRRKTRAYTSSFAGSASSLDALSHGHYLDQHTDTGSDLEHDDADRSEDEEHESEDSGPFDDKYVVEQKHRAFWELVMRLLNQNDVVLMVRYVLEFLREHLESSACAVFLVDQNTQELSRITRGQTSLSGIAPRRGIVGRTFKKRVPFCKPDFRDENQYDAEVDLLQEFPGQKLFSVPLSENDVVYAIIQTTTSRATSRPDIDDLYIKLLTWLGPILSSCMRNCIEFHDVMLSERTQKALLHIISSSDTEDTVLNLVEGVIVGACHITKAERVSLFMVDWETEELWSLSTSYHDEKLRVPLNSSILGLAAKSQTTLNVSDPASDERFNPATDRRRGIRVQRALYVPVGIQQADSGKSTQPLAVLEIINKEDGAEFTFDDECAFEAFACEVAVILRRRSTEISYMKLLADTLSEQMLAQRATSQVDLLDVYTSYSYSSTARANTIDHVAASSMAMSGTGSMRNATLATLAASTSSGNANANALSTTVGCTCGRAGGSPHTTLKTPQQRSGRLKFDFHSRPENSLFSGVAVDAKFFSWEFNVFNVDSDLLPQLLEGMYLDFKVDEILKTSKYVIQNFIVAMKSHYHPNPFHNFLHAFSVVHATYLLLTTTSAAQMLQPLDIASCLIAALGHDVDHPGHTNGFEIVSGSQLALLYSDESVLERHHAYTTFRLMAKEKNANLLQNLSPADFRQARKFIVTAILGTDMANHFKFCEALEKTLRPAAHHLDTNGISSAKREASAINLSVLGSDGKPKQSTELMSVLRDAVLPTDGASTPRGSGVPSLASSSTSGSAPGSMHKLPLRSSSCRRETACGWAYNGTLDDRLFLVKALVHTSDLSGQVYPTHVALKWSNMISKEFAYQALLEQAEGLPISYKHIDDPLEMVVSQLFFAQKIVSPLWNLMYLMFPDLDVCVRNLATNVRHYEHELDRLKLLREQGGEDADESALLSSSYRDSLSSCGDEGDGLAVPGGAKHNPAQFSSFRVIPEDEEDAQRASHEALPELAEEELSGVGSERPPVARRVLSSVVSASGSRKSLRSRGLSEDSSRSASSSSSEPAEVFDVDLEPFQLE